MPVTFNLPLVGGDENAWGPIVNAGLTAIRDFVNALETALGQARGVADSAATAAAAAQARADEAYALAAAAPTATAQPVRVVTTTTSRTFGLADGQSVVLFNAPSDVNAVIPLDETANHPVGTVIEGVQVGAGAVNAVAASGVTPVQLLVGPRGGRTFAPGDRLHFLKVGANSWHVS